MDVRELCERLPEGLRQRKAIAGLVVAGVVAAAVLGAAALFALRTPTGPAPRLVLPIAGADPAAAAPGGGGGATAGDAAGGAGGAGGGGAGGVATSGGTGGGAGGVGGGGATAGATAGGTAGVAPAGLATVHVAGAVVSPGVYALPAGARVADAVTAAGGPLAEAEVDRLNLAARVADGDRVHVPRKGDPADASASGASAGVASGAGPVTLPAARLDLNTATIEQLDTLPGVGPATAQAIVTYRTRHGRFRSVTELLEVPGIGPAKLEAVRDLVRV